MLEERLAYIVALIVTMLSVLTLFSHIYVSGIPTSPYAGDHPSHLYKVYLVFKGDTRATEWFGVDLFWVSPSFFALAWLFKLLINDPVLVYKLIVILSDFLLVAVSIVFPFSAPSIAFLQFVNIAHGVVPTVYAFAIGVISVSLFALGMLSPAPAALLVVISLLFQPTVGGAFAIIYGIVAAQRFFERSSAFLLLLVVLIGAVAYGYYFLVQWAYPDIGKGIRLWKSGHVYYSSPYFWPKYGLPIRILDEFFVLFAAFLSGTYFLIKKRWIYGISLLLMLLYFVFGPAIPLLSAFPIASLHPFVYLSVLLYSSGLFLWLTDKRAALLLVFASMFIAYSVYTSRVGWFESRGWWHYVKFEKGLAACSGTILQQPVTYIFTYDQNVCAPYWMGTTYLNIEYNRITPQGWLVELLPAKTYSDLGVIQRMCEHGEGNSLNVFLADHNATLVVVAEEPLPGALRQSATCAAFGVFVFGAAPLPAPPQ